VANWAAGATGEDGVAWRSILGQALRCAVAACWRGAATIHVLARHVRAAVPPLASAVIRRHQFEVADNRRLAHLCGPLDAHLRSIEAALGVTLQRREAQFRVQGPREAVERSIALLERLYARAQAPIGERSLQLALLDAQTGAGQAAASAAPEPGAPVVLHTRHNDLAGRTANQMQYLRQMLSHDISFGVGPAGTGKTFLAVACAVDALERQTVQRIVLTRPAVEAGERLGFLPGDLAQKVDPYLRPLYDALYDLMGFDRVVKALEKQQIEIAPLAFMRGRTLNHAFVILDEAQNTTPEQMKMFLTRIGFGSRCVVTGDVSQIDLPKGQTSGLVEARQVLGQVKGIAFTDFTTADVVRHPLVARIVEAYEAHQPTHAQAPAPAPLHSPALAQLPDPLQAEARDLDPEPPRW
jgi:phosphate starvation-inducible PhoH-like protein